METKHLLTSRAVKTSFKPIKKYLFALNCKKRATATTSDIKKQENYVKPVKPLKLVELVFIHIVNQFEATSKKKEKTKVEVD